MIIVPRETPSVQNLNSYYLDLPKLLEHCQGEFGSGALHFRSSTCEGIVFFDIAEVVGGMVQDASGNSAGPRAWEVLLERARDSNLIIEIYKIPSDRLYFWANLPAAEPIHSDLSTDFTDLKALLKKLVDEKLTGFVDVSIADGSEEGLVFFNHGKIVGGSYSWENGEPREIRAAVELLVKKATEKGAVFHVNRLVEQPPPSAGDAPPVEGEDVQALLLALGELLGALEGALRSRKKTSAQFRTLLKRKLMDKAETYPFLDPFVGEFEYDDRGVSYAGKTPPRDLVEGVLETVREIAEEQGVGPQVRVMFQPWNEAHRDLLERLSAST